MSAEIDVDLLLLFRNDARLNICQDLLGHPEQSPTLAELDWTNPSISYKEISRHVGLLEDHDVVRRTRFPDVGQKDQHVIAELTDEGRAILDRYTSFVDQEDEIREEYASVEMPEEIVDLEERERP